MVAFRRLAPAVLVLAGLHPPAFAAGEPGESGRAVFERLCAGCHEGTNAQSNTLGPRLAGVVGRKAGTEPTGVHSRAAIESGTVWTRDNLRRFLSDPARQMPGTIMPQSVTNPADTERVLDYLESLR